MNPTCRRAGSRKTCVPDCRVCPRRNANNGRRSNCRWNAWLTPKGRVIAVFALLKLEQERVLLLLPDADAGEFAAQLQRFVFRRKLKIVVADGLQVSGAFGKPDSAESARIGMVGEAI